jgi:hypothetical protein
VNCQRQVILILAKVYLNIMRVFARDVVGFLRAAGEGCTVCLVRVIVRVVGVWVRDGCFYSANGGEII